jgi:heterodisulfide reductase subunit A
LIDKVRENPLINVYNGSTVSDVSGFVGNFTTKLSGGQTIGHGVAVIATGGLEYKPVEYMYGASDRVLTQLELAEAMDAGDARVSQAKNIVLIQCVGSREPERPYCSRVCCAKSARLALSLKEKNPATNVYVLYRDIRTYGFYEDLYTEARQKGVIFLRYDRDAKPVVAKTEAGLKVTVRELILGVDMVIDADLMGLAAAILPGDNADLSRFFKLPLNQEGFFLEAHMKLRPVEFSTDGVFMCGVAHGPKNLEENIAQAKAAAGRAGTVLAKDAVVVEGKCSVVNKQKCVACGVCELVCPAKAITVDLEQRVSVVNEALCKGCGACVASCRSGALNLKGCTDEQIMAMLEAI